MKPITILIGTILFAVSFTGTVFASDSQVFLPIITDQKKAADEPSTPFDYVAEEPHAGSPLTATLQVDVFDKCGNCGSSHRLSQVSVEISYRTGTTTTTIVEKTDWEGIVKFNVEYDSLTVRIVTDPQKGAVTSTAKTVYRCSSATSQPCADRWGVTFKRSW